MPLPLGAVNVAVRGWATNPELATPTPAIAEVVEGYTLDDVRLLVDAGDEKRGQRGADPDRNWNGSRRRRMLLTIRVDLVLAMVARIFGPEAALRLDPRPEIRITEKGLRTLQDLDREQRSLFTGKVYELPLNGGEP